MNERKEQFLKAIIAEPGDDSLRLVYADWLEEQGDEQSELIRVQIEQEQLSWHDDRWWELGARARTLIRDIGPRLVREKPVVRNFEWGIESTAPHLCPDPSFFRRGFVESGTGKDSHALRASSTLGYCRTLLSDLRLPKVSVERLCQEWRILRRLRRLDLGGAHLRAEGMQRLSQCEYLQDLRALNLLRNDLGREGVNALSQSPLTNLRSLDLSANGFETFDLEILLPWSPLTSLKALTIGENRMQVDLYILLNSGRLRHVSWLDLKCASLGNAQVAMIADPKLFEGLTHLCLSDAAQQIDTDVLLTLVRSPAIHHLRVLALFGLQVTNEFVEQLVDRPAAAKLQSLSLFGAPITAKGMRAIAHSTNLQLRRLELAGASPWQRRKPLVIDESTATELAWSPALSSVEQLRLAEVQWQGEAQQLLKKRFGDVLSTS